MVQKNPIISNPNVSVDCVVFGFDGADLKVLLVERYRRDNLDFQDDTLVLPGDLINNNEDLNEAASRVLYDLTGLTKIFLQQIGAFGSPKRLSKPKDIAWLDAVRMNPEARVITIGYYALINIKNYKVRPSSFAKQSKPYRVKSKTSYYPSMSAAFSTSMEFSSSQAVCRVGMLMSSSARCRSSI